MPQFAFRATDRMGNSIEGTVSADDQARAEVEVRAMGYVPAAVQPAPGQVGSAPPLAPTPSAPSMSLAATAAAPARAAPVDLSQPYSEPVLPAGEPVDATAEMTARMARLEPWERSVAAAAATAREPEPTQSLTPPTQSLADATQALPGTSPPSAGSGTPGAAASASKERYRILERSQSTLGKRALEVLVYPLFSGVVVKDLAAFYRQFATLLGAGLPIFQSLVALEANTHNAKLKEIAHAGQLKVQIGGRFSDVMTSRPWIFRSMQVALVRAAEQGGMLDDVFRQIADYVEHELSIKRLISMETLYPKIVLFVALMIIGRRGITNMAHMAVVNLVIGGSAGAPYGLHEYFMDTIGFGLMLLVPILAFVAVFRLFLVNVPGVREGYDMFKLRIPVIGGLVRMFAVARFARTYAALSHAGFPVASSVVIAGEAAGNYVILGAARRAAVRAEQGALVSESLRSTGQFPSMAVDMMHTGEASGTLDTIMDKVGEYNEAEGRSRTHTAAMIFSAVVLILVGIMVAYFVITFYAGAAATTMSAGAEGG